MEEQLIAEMDLDRIVGELSAEFAGVFDTPEVEQMAVDSAGRLAEIRSGSLRPEQVAGFTRQRLIAQGRNEGTLFVGVPSVIFVCVHNAGRSQMSAGFARQLGGERLLVFSGGSAPAESINPQAVEAMSEAGVDISDAYPLSFTDEIVRASDVVVTMGCGDACPFFPGKRYLDWELADPHGASLEDVRLVRDEIEQRVKHLLAEMGV